MLCTCRIGYYRLSTQNEKRWYIIKSYPLLFSVQKFSFTPCLLKTKPTEDGSVLKWVKSPNKKIFFSGTASTGYCRNLVDCVLWDEAAFH